MLILARRRVTTDQLRPSTPPHALRIPPRDGHPALRGLQEGCFRFGLAVTSFRLRAHLSFCIPAFQPRPSRHYPGFRILRPPEPLRAAQHTLCTRPTSAGPSRSLSTPVARGRFTDLSCYCARTFTPMPAAYTPMPSGQGWEFEGIYPLTRHVRLVGGFCSSGQRSACNFPPTLCHPHTVAVRFALDGLLTGGLAPPRPRHAGRT
jgi:hypothetical protein